MNRLFNNLYSDYNQEELLANLIKRLSNHFDITEFEAETLKSNLEKVLLRLELCFNKVDNKYFRRDDLVYFNSLHSGQYLIFLYIFSNVISRVDLALMNKLYYLNKILHSVDIYGEIILPETFFFEHPLGMVLGRAVYGNNFFAMQGCTVGGNRGCYPVLGENFKMYSNSKILGQCNVGDNVILAANTYVKDCDIPSNTVVFGSSPNLVFKENKFI